MSDIIKFLKSIGELIVSLVRFVIEMVGDILKMGKLVLDTVARVPQMIGFLPTIVVEMFVVALSVICIYKYLGRT